MANDAHLVVIGSNPPTTTGERTRRRVELARELLGFRTVEIVNLFSLPTYRSNGLAEVGQTEAGWDQARGDIQTSIAKASAVLLAYGVGVPTGSARHHYRSQVAWLDDLLIAEGVAVWWVGGEPRHPSRWHRHTHRIDPTREFRDLLPEVLTQREDARCELA